MIAEGYIFFHLSMFYAAYILYIPGWRVKEKLFFVLLKPLKNTIKRRIKMNVSREIKTYQEIFTPV